MTITLDLPLLCFSSDSSSTTTAEDTILRINHSLEKGPLLEESYQQDPLTFNTAEDCSIDDWTVSTASSSDEYDVSSRCSSSSSSSSRKAVTFSEELVSQVWTRPRTPTEDVRKLFYSSEDTQRFRQEYRFERKRTEETGDSHKKKKHYGDSMTLKTHRIQRVVVLHKDIQQTFVEPDHDLALGSLSFVGTDSHHDNDTADVDTDADPADTDPSTVGVPQEPNTTTSTSASTSNYTTSSSTITNHNKVTSTCYASQDFFDNDSFWTGQITWY